MDVIKCPCCDCDINYHDCVCFDCDCSVQGFKVFGCLLLYWIYETLTLLLWLSLGIGVAQASSFCFNAITPYEMDNSIQSYITLYTLALGVGVQTNFNIMFFELDLDYIMENHPRLYYTFKTGPIWILSALSLVELLLQLQLRYEGPKVEDEQPLALTRDDIVDNESLVTLRFLLALAYVAYYLGMKVRREYKLNKNDSPAPNRRPKWIKYCAVFGLLYTVELFMLFVWGLPVVLLALVFRYFYFDPFLTYFGLAVIGIIMGYFTSTFERNIDFRQMFRDEDSYHFIHGEVRCNVLLFSIVPLISRWYFRIQFQYPDFDTSFKVNLTFFSVNVSFLLMYFVKCVLINDFKSEERKRMERDGMFEPPYFEDQPAPIATAAVPVSSISLNNTSIYIRPIPPFSKRSESGNNVLIPLADLRNNNQLLSFSTTSYEADLESSSSEDFHFIRNAEGVLEAVKNSHSLIDDGRVLLTFSSSDDEDDDEYDEEDKPDG